MEGYDNYLAEPQRQKLSSLYNTVKNHFKHVLLMPGLKIFFLCRDISIKTDIPARLAEKGIITRYIRGYYYGNLTKERISDLNNLMDPNTPKNSDDSPLHSGLPNFPLHLLDLLPALPGSPLYICFGLSGKNLYFFQQEQ